MAAKNRSVPRPGLVVVRVFFIAYCAEVQRLRLTGSRMDAGFGLERLDLLYWGKSM